MSRILIATLLAAGLASAAQAAERPAQPAAEAVEERDIAQMSGREIAELGGYEQVDSIPALTRLHSFHALDRDTLIIWATPFRPYLVELRHPSHDLRFAHAIGVTQRSSRIYPGFDSVQVRGFRYPIDRIYELSREEAKELTRKS